MKDDKTLPILVAEFKGIRFLLFKWISSPFFIPLTLTAYVIPLDQIFSFIFWCFFGIVDLSRPSLISIFGTSLGFVLHLLYGLFVFFSYFFMLYKMYMKFKKTPKKLFWCNNHFEAMYFDRYSGINEEGDFYYDSLRIDGRKLKSTGRFYLLINDNGILNELSLKKMIDLDMKYKEGYF